MSEILLIDAEQPFADQMAGALRGRGFQVKQIEDGKEGLEYAKEHRPDLIVLCVELPKMSGYSICNKLKKDSELKQIPLIITSKEATPETFAQHKKLKTRAEDYLIKPFDEDALLEKIGGLIELPAAPAAEPAPFGGDDDGIDALDALDALDSESEIQLDDADLDALNLEEDAGNAAGAAGDDADDLLASLGPDPMAEEGTDALGDLDADDMLKGLEADDDPLAGLEEAAPAPPPADASDELDLGSPVQADDELSAFDENFDALAPEPDVPAPEPPPAPAPQAAEGGAPSAADLEALSQLRRENTELKAKVVELESKLRAAEEAAIKAQEVLKQNQSSSSSSAREVLSLKEKLRAKDKEMEQLKDEIFEHEKKVVEVSEELEKLRAETAGHGQALAEKDAEIASLKAKVEAITAERDALEKQVNERLRTAEAERDKLKAELDGLKQVAAEKEELHAKVEALEKEKQKSEDQLLKAYQRLKNEEALRERARQATEIALAALSGEVDVGAAGKEQSLDLESLDA